MARSKAAVPIAPSPRGCPAKLRTPLNEAGTDAIWYPCVLDKNHGNVHEYRINWWNDDSDKLPAPSKETR